MKKEGLEKGEGRRRRRVGKGKEGIRGEDKEEEEEDGGGGML